MKANLAVNDVLMACKALNSFGDQAIDNLKHGIANPLVEDEKDDLKHAVDLMRRTLNCITPLISATIDPVNETTVSPVS